MTEDETRREAAAGAEEPNHQAEDDHSTTEKKDFVPSAPPFVEEVLDNKSAQERVNARDEDLSAPSSNRTPLSEVFSANDGQIKPTGQETVDLDKKMTEQFSAAEHSEKDKEVESTVTDPEPKEGKLKEKVAKKSKKQKDKSGKDAAKGDEDENKLKKGVDMVDEEGGKAEIDTQSMVDDKEEDKQMKQGKGLQSLEKDDKKDKKAEKKSKEDEGAKKEKQKSDKKNGKENGEAKGEKKKEKKEKKEKKNKGSSERIQKKLEKMNAKIGRILAKKDEYVQRLKEAQEKERLEAQEKERQEAENRAPQEREDSAATLGKSENDKGGNDWRRESLTEEECLAKLEEGLVEVVQKQPSGSLSRTHSVVPPPPEEEDLAEVREVLKDLPDLKISDDSEQTTSGLQEWSDDNETKHAPQSDSPTKAPITSEGKDYSTQSADSKAGGSFRREAGMIL